LLLIIIIIILISITNLTWGIIYSNLAFDLSVIYYIFSFMFIVMILNLYQYHKNEILEIVYKALIVSVIIQMLISPFAMVTNTTRQTLFFNNPNQLGYYALLSFSIITLLYYILKKSPYLYLTVSIMTTYLALLSNSSASLIAISVMLIIQFIMLFVLRLNTHQKLITIAFIAGIILVGNTLIKDITDIDIIQNTQQRFESKSEKSQSVFEERRYDRILENYELLIFGAGEGIPIKRFGRGEIHSTLFSFLFNYGLITTMFLLILLLIFIKQPTVIALIILFAIHFYGLTHNGIRQPLFWLATIIIYMGNEQGELSIKSIITHISNPIKTKYI